MPANTERIAKNTLMLYFRHIVIMLVNLYAVRIVLNTLGAEDYGIYNVVGGLVIMFTFINTAMTNATQRFLSFALGQNDTEQARNVYSISIIIHVLMAILVVVLAQTIGLWFFHTLLNIPPERKTAAFVVFQLSVAATVLGIIRVPYGATIIAHEKMSVFALTGIIEAILKLIAVFALTVILFDKLVLYAFLVLIIGAVIFLIQKIYCNRTFETARFRYNKDNNLFRQIAEFSGWSIFGNFANICLSQGINILLNIFHGVVVNAALGIATQVNSAVYRFVNSFQTAFNPQIIKSYSAKDYDYFMCLIFQTSKTSFFLLLFFVLPLYINAGFVLQIWLKDVPEFTIKFTRLILLISLINALAGPLWMSIQATGDIKKYQLIESGFKISNMPFSYLFLFFGFSPIWVLINKLAINVATFIWRIFFLSKKINLPIFGFLREVILPVTVIAGVSSFITLFFYNYSFSLFSEWTILFLSCIVSTISIGFLVYFIGISTNEKELLKKWAIKKLSKK